MFIISRNSRRNLEQSNIIKKISIKEARSSYVGLPQGFKKFIQHLNALPMKDNHDYPRTFRQTMRLRSTVGSAALEYVLVTTFAAITGIAALGFVGSMMKDKVQEMADKLGIETSQISDISFNPFSE